MPGGDRTGPAGMGPTTGRGAGFCAGYSIPGCMNSPFDWGLGRGRGGGRGRRNWFHATGLTGWQRYTDHPISTAYAEGTASYGLAATKEQKLETLKNQAKFLEDSLKDIKKRMDQMEKENNN